MNKSLNIFFTIDNKFAPHCSVTIASILKNAHENDKINIGILSSGLSDESKKNISDLKKIKDFNITFHSVDNSIFSSYTMPDYINSSAALFRYLIPTLAKDCDKALYLDADVVVRHSLSELYNTELGDKYIAGVEDFAMNMGPKRLKLNSSIAEPYFNSGVLLMNTKMWREDGLFQKLIDTTNKLNPKMLEQLDQDAINIVCTGKKIVLPPKYNLLSCYTDKAYFTSYTSAEMEKAIADPVIVHFSAATKPWHFTGFPLNNYAYEYYKYLRLTPYYNKSAKFITSLLNPKVLKSLLKIKKNTAVRFFFDLLLLPLRIFALLIGVFSTFKYMKKFEKRMKL